MGHLHVPSQVATDEEMFGSYFYPCKTEAIMNELLHQAVAGWRAILLARIVDLECNLAEQTQVRP